MIEVDIFYSRNTLRARKIVYKQRETFLGIKKLQGIEERNKAAIGEDILTVDCKKIKGIKQWRFSR